MKKVFYSFNKQMYSSENKAIIKNAEKKEEKSGKSLLQLLINEVENIKQHKEKQKWTRFFCKNQRNVLIYKKVS